MALPLVSVGSTLAQHVLALPVAIGAAAIVTGRVPATVVALVPLLALQALLCAGPAFALASAHSRLRDTARLVTVALVPLFYATPVFYDESALDAAPLLRLNPMAPIVDGYRAALLRGTWPAPVPLGVVALAGAVLLAAGITLYRGRMGRFLEEL
jgi:lipopolysaccharide transport system permease protein